MKLALSKIRLDGGTQTRVSIDEDVVTSYAERMEEGDKFPSIVVYFDGTDYYLADGFHRYLAAQRLKYRDIEVVVHKGTLKDCIQHALGANHTNGLQRTTADKRKAVAIALETFKDWSDRRVAEMCCVGNQLVGDVRRQLCDSHSSLGYTSEPREGSDGRKRKPPRARKAKPKPQEPEESDGPHDCPESEEAEVQLDPDSLEAAQADLEEYVRRLYELARFGRKILGAEGNELTRPYCVCYSLLSVVNPLHQVARVIKNDMPVGGTAKNPKLARDQVVADVK